MYDKHCDDVLEGNAPVSQPEIPLMPSIPSQPEIPPSLRLCKRAASPEQQPQPLASTVLRQCPGRTHTLAWSWRARPAARTGAAAARPRQAALPPARTAAQATPRPPPGPRSPWSSCMRGRASCLAAHLREQHCVGCHDGITTSGHTHSTGTQHALEAGRPDGRHPSRLRSAVNRGCCWHAAQRAAVHIVSLCSSSPVQHMHSVRAGLHTRHGEQPGLVLGGLGGPRARGAVRLARGGSGRRPVGRRAGRLLRRPSP